MKTPKLLLVFVFACSFMGCKKDKDKSKTELLTSKTWIYDEYFTNYNSSNTILAYKRTKTANSLNLSLNKTQFNSDGTVTETNQNGQVISGTWKFLNNESQTETKNQVGTFTSNIISLSENSYIWYDPVTNSGTYAKMIPLQ